jgi:hypothetical protein
VHHSSHATVFSHRWLINTSSRCEILDLVLRSCKKYVLSQIKLSESMNRSVKLLLKLMKNGEWNKLDDFDTQMKAMSYVPKPRRISGFTKQVNMISANTKFLA